MKKGLIVVAVLGAIVLLVAGTVIKVRNGLVVANETITASWAQVENVMQRRADLIPNLVETVKGIAKQEKDVFSAIADARARLAGARSINEKIEANRQIESALARLLVVVENYPQLKSNQNFLQLQDELAGTENRIAVERLRYNEAVKNFNTMVGVFPNNVIAGLFNFQRRDDYFEASESAKAVPKVNFQ